MNYSPLGRSGLKVSQACLGAMNFGTSGVLGTCEEPEATQIVARFLDAGNNFIDTANAYSSGQSEEIVGRAVKGRRESVVLATKAFMPQGRGPNDRGLSRVHLTQTLEASLRRLGTDYVDLYQCHQWDPSTPIEETMATLDGFVREGKVRYIGCSNFSAAQIVEAQWAAQRLGTTPLISLQPQYSLAAREIEAEVLPTAQRHGLGTMIWSPLAGGVLTGRYHRGTDPSAESRMGRLRGAGHPMAQAMADGFLTDRNLVIAEEVGKVAGELGVTPAEVALSWAAAREGVTSVIIGPRNEAQLQGNLSGLRLSLPAEATARLDEVSRPS
jgi:aryl-alcohol dehydrogenase-like predicted oxidoreductase